MTSYDEKRMSYEYLTCRSSYEPPFTETLWDFSLRYYQLADIQKACLRIQDECAGNVLLLLWNKWLDQQQCHIDERYHTELSHMIIQQSEMTLAPLRLARKSLKDAVLLNQEQKTQQKHSILSVELIIEREILAYLHRCTDQYFCELTASTNNVRSMCETQYVYDYLVSIDAKQALRDVLLVPV